MILLKMEQEIIDFIGDNKYVKLQRWVIYVVYLSLVFRFNYSSWTDSGIDKTLFSMFADWLHGDFIGVRKYMLMGIVAWTM